ncbi:hypothetical protein [Halolamina sediminis]|uniref:hypothetical protein n=1 Tax=Halolamina sediminis TaxID=1480675 RepID=UPI0006B631CF|nr:hypothetical protein [Halolamina sediminis]
MNVPNLSAGGPSQDSRSDDSTTTRRRLLAGVGAGATGLLLGAGTMGTAAAKGKGGRAAVPVDELPDGTRTFHFDEPTGEFVRKTCEKGGNGIVLAGWSFYYEGEDPAETDRTLFTRDNAIDTAVQYTLSEPGTIDCGEFVLTTYSPDGRP